MDLQPQQEKQPVPPPQLADAPDDRITVEYLPASHPFHREYEGNVTLSMVRADAMTFFKVSDHKDRDTHQFFLEFKGQRLTNMAETLDQLLGPHRRAAKFNLVEQITPGATRYE
jgi:hypothetical protein